MHSLDKRGGDAQTVGALVPRSAYHRALLVCDGRDTAHRDILGIAWTRKFEGVRTLRRKCDMALSLLMRSWGSTHSRAEHPSYVSALCGCPGWLCVGERNTARCEYARRRKAAASRVMYERSHVVKESAVCDGSAQIMKSSWPQATVSPGIVRCAYTPFGIPVSVKVDVA